MRHLKISITAIGFIFFSLLSCSRQTCHDEMVQLLKDFNKTTFDARNQFYPEAKLPFMDSLLSLPHSSPGQIRYCKFLKAAILLELGKEDGAIALLEDASKEANDYELDMIWKQLAMAYVRSGERTNCIANHASESCTLPLRGLGVHQIQDGSRNAIERYTRLVQKDPRDYESLWLLNLAYLTVGEYPEKVPAEFLVPGLEGDTTYKIKPMRDIAGHVGLDVRNMAGGSITEDFDNDGYLDIVTSSMGMGDELHYFRNNADGTFSDISMIAGLQGITGGLNIMQTDYNNDGHKDIFVTRGGWKREFGNEPNSLVRNNGDGTFTDVTTVSGLLSFRPTQTATWNDFNNDGWLDVYIGNETAGGGMELTHPCELYMNNKDGTFREIAALAKCDVVKYVKGVTSGDYDNDGWVDLFVSTMDGGRKLLKNNGMARKEVAFTDVTHLAGLDLHHGRTFPTWFWDYDNDGWLDIFVCDYTFEKSLAYYAAAEKLGVAAGSPEKMLLYHNNHDGTFTNVAAELGLTQNVFAMGSNFGDIDNDGFLDMYLGSGNPNFQSLVPNKMFKSIGGKKFVDVTYSARVGHLQKGHGVSFADMDNDGDQDIYIDMGGAYIGDSYQNSFFLNPGQNDNNWISLQLEGNASNRAAIGTRVIVTFEENGLSRSVYRDVNSGGSFGSSPLRREIGVGQAKRIDKVEIRWQGSGEIQVFRNIEVNQFIKIKEGSSEIQKVQLKTLSWVLTDELCLPEAGAL